MNTGSIINAGSIANAGGIANHRGREDGLTVYPCYSRRSKGLSIGVNLYLDKKRCPFDCPYCEVFPFEDTGTFSLSVMERALHAALLDAKNTGVPVRDISFSGNGEPTLSPDFPAALACALRIRDEVCPEAKLVVISCGAGLLKDTLFTLLADFARNKKLDLWLKLDAGTEAWFKTINGSSLPFVELVARICAFTACAPATIQTMHCTVNGAPPPDDDIRAWERILVDMVRPGNIRLVQIYGKARPSPHDPVCEALPFSALTARADALREAFKNASSAFPEIEVFE
jgi:histidinol dehydrogenase